MLNRADPVSGMVVDLQTCIESSRERRDELFGCGGITEARLLGKSVGIAKLASGSKRAGIESFRPAKGAVAANRGTLRAWLRGRVAGCRRI